MQKSLAKRAELFIREHRLFAAGERVLIGLSGGADSVCLLHVLTELSEVFSLTLGAFHMHHGIRGEEADRDEAFSRELCASFGVDYYCIKEDVPAYARAHGMGTEEAGRSLRYQAAERLASEQGYDKIALAHQQNDVAETFLFHLFRGSSVTGLSSIPVKRGRIVRPLLFCGREEIEEYLREQGLSFCTDKTNDETEYTRNKIRHNILSYAQAEINHGAIAHTARAAGELRELSAYLAREAEALCAQAEKTERGLRLPVLLLEQVPTPVREMAVHSLLTEVAGCSRDMTKEHVTAVSGLCRQQSGKQVDLPYGMIAKREFDFLVIGQERQPETGLWVPAACKVEVPGEYRISSKGDTLTFRCFSYEKNGEIPKNKYTKWFDYDKIEGALYLRLRKDGDRMGMVQGSKSVKQLYMEHKIEKEERGRSLLLADEAQVLWIPGVRSCDNYRIDDKTKTILEVRLSGGNKGEG